MSKSVSDYLASDRTANQDAFLDWVIRETGVSFKTANERKAFDLGVRCAGLYSRFQAAKREEKKTAAVQATSAKKAAQRSSARKPAA